MTSGRLNPNAPWTPERIDRLKAMWADGLSAAQIAKALTRTTRNAVIGIVHRHGLSGRSKEAQNQASSFTNRARPRQSRIYAKPVTQLLPKPRLIESIAAPKVWTERQFGECAYPVGGEGAETLSCCNGTGGERYCAAHAKVMFAKPATKAQRDAAAKMREAKKAKKARAA